MALIIMASIDDKKDKKFVPPLDRDEVEKYLAEIGLVTMDEMKEDSSAQSLAVDWLIKTDIARVAVPLIHLKEPNIFFLQRYIMVLFFIKTQGKEDGWTSNWNFMHAENDICSWNENMADENGNTHVFGAECDSDGILRRLEIPRSNLFGSIPREVGYLTNLNFLALDYNKLTGNLPPEMEYLINCQHLSLQGNEISGPLPNFLGALTNLQFLGLGQNLFEGVIPETFQLLTNLITLGLNQNVLKGGFSNIRTLRNMRRLYLDSNSFEERLDIIDFANMLELEELDLSHNQLSGSISDEFFEYPNLSILDLSHNKLNGELPNRSQDNYNLKILALNDNHLTGSVKENIFKVKRLLHLNLAVNNFSGYIPGSIKRLTDLRYLSLSDNPLKHSSIPTEIAHLTKLEEVSFKRSNREGAIPIFFSKFPNLMMLDLEGNEFSGEIPEDLGKISRLEFLAINRNENIIGTVPTSVQSLPMLEIILMDKTSLSGDLNTLCDRFGGLNGKTAIEVAGADCLDGQDAELVCDCCTICCHDIRISKKCSQNDDYRVLEDGWKNSYKNEGYEYSKNFIGDSS
eukprot:CAMPEP_0194194394 /NCGR_PEP_ID=MMETSP0154-20130528/75561_1 /TAXON_ID=1049557 /ORGANISM="Thalassiothrix antarctica, Strain L6-D1" /LENGTH=571 /DNA_ID=CAMNT_0038918821 /DNA_START=212 /DNA_END=1927 /DNA_ORIENTATION=+